MISTQICICGLKDLRWMQKIVSLRISRIKKISFEKLAKSKICNLTRFIDSMKQNNQGFFKLVIF